MAAESQVTFTQEEKQEIANKIYKAVDALNTALRDGFVSGVLSTFNADATPGGLQLKFAVYEHRTFTNPNPPPADPAGPIQPITN
jgi:hypothetical protein